MQAKLVAYLEQLLLKYVLPYLYNRLKDWVEGLLWKDKVRRAYQKTTKEAQSKFESIVDNPQSTPEQRADAYQDLINSKPDNL